ncbi:MAG: cytochrome b [Marivibrio sp.]|uniref:cytochrome b n=1 Tax=Marivibrio sp. TaxID=2039719 RepID=UPI0032EEBC9B
MASADPTAVSREPDPGRPARYDPVAQALHWGMAALIIGNFGLALYMEDLPPVPSTIELYNLHKSLGLAALALAAFRLGWRWRHPAPKIPDDHPRWEKTAAAASHYLLYLLIFLQPLSGLMIAFASQYPTTVFWAVNLPSPIDPSKAIESAAKAVHYWGQWAMAGVVGVHVLAALRHHFVLRNDILKRMLPGG